MISDKMQKELNEQIALEGYASFLYLSMASWCDHQGMEGCARFMHRQSDEERMHMLKIFHYLSEVDGRALAPAQHVQLGAQPLDLIQHARQPRALPADIARANLSPITPCHQRSTVRPHQIEPPLRPSAPCPTPRTLPP